MKAPNPVFPSGISVVAQLGRENPALSHVMIVADLPGAPNGFALALSHGSALELAEELQKASAMIERHIHGKSDA